MVGHLKKIPGIWTILRNAGVFSVTFFILLMNNFSDQYFVVQLGRVEAAAYTLDVPLFWILISASAVLGTAYSADIRKRLAENNLKAANQAAIRAAVYSVLFGFVFSIISAIAIIVFFQAIPEEDVRNAALIYMAPMLALFFILTLNSVLGGLLNAEGKYWVYVVALFIMLSGNATFDYYFLQTDMGIFGNGLSTVVGATLSLMFELAYYYTGRTRIKLSLKNFSWSFESIRGAIMKIRKLLIRHLAKDISEVFIRFSLYLTYTLSYGVPMMYSTLIATIGMGAGAYLSSEYEKILKEGDRETALALFIRSSLVILAVTLAMSLICRSVADILLGPFVPFDASKDSFDIMIWTLGVLCFTAPFVSLKYLANAVSAPVGRIRNATLLITCWAVAKAVAFMYLVDISYEYAIYTILVERFLSCTVSVAIALWHIYHTYPEEPPQFIIPDIVPSQS